MAKKTKTKKELFLELAKPDENGISRWVSVTKFTGTYDGLKLGNGGSWCRKEGGLAKEYIIEKNKEGNKIVKIRLNGFNNDYFSNNINKEIKDEIKNKRCVVLGTSNPQVDHKNGRKNDKRVMETKNQKKEDFQPLSQAANCAKRQFCKECKDTNKRYDARKLGYPISFYKGNETHDGTESGCEGCFWYDPIEFRKHLKEILEKELEKKFKQKLENEK